MAYSYIALQQMNLVHKFPQIYWRTACLSVNAGAINEEDYYNLVDQGIIELSDEDDVRSQTKIQYGKVATAISNMRGEIDVELPDINDSRLGFTPNAKTNSILYGIKGISRVGEKVIQEIIINRPYTSLMDFEEKLNSGRRKTISKDRVINLIKAGAFDKIENKPRREILLDYVKFISDEKYKLDLRNFLMLIRKGLVPETLAMEVKIYNFTRYLRKNRYKDLYYKLDEISRDFFVENFPVDKIIQKEDVELVLSNWWDQIYNLYMNTVRSWIQVNHDALVIALNKELYAEQKRKYAHGNLLDWELQALNFFHSGHPLSRVTLPIETNRLDELVEDNVVGYWDIRGKKIPKMYLYVLKGTVIEKNKQKSSFTLAVPDGVIEVKVFKQQYAKLVHESDLDEDDEDYMPNEENFLEKGTHLLVIGIKRGDMFLPKTYKRTGYAPISKIVLDEEGNFKDLIAKEEHGAY